MKQLLFEKYTCLEVQRQWRHWQLTQQYHSLTTFYLTYGFFQTFGDMQWWNTLCTRPTKRTCIKYSCHTRIYTGTECAPKPYLQRKYRIKAVQIALWMCNDTPVLPLATVINTSVFLCYSLMSQISEWHIHKVLLRIESSCIWLVEVEQENIDITFKYKLKFLSSQQNNSLINWHSG